jgi:hypothetical protein
VAYPPLQFFAPFGTEFKGLLIETFKKSADELGAIPAWEVENLLFQAVIR